MAKHVAVLMGGWSSERPVSLNSGNGCADALEAGGFRVTRVDVGRDVADVLSRLRPDVAFNALHGPFGEDGCIQGLLEWLDVPYVGSDVLASAICMDKLTLKRLCAQHGLPQVDFVAVGEEGWRERCAALGSPLWVKPSRLGSSVGISRVEGVGEQLDAAVELALRHDPRVIVEASAQGREVECSLLGNERPEASLPGEVVAHGEWYDYETKYGEGGMELVVPADLPEDQTARLRELAVEAFALGGCSGLARCDFFVEPDGSILVNEVNTMPGFTQTSVYAKLWEASGLPYPQLCDRLIELACERYEKVRSHEF
jgi:D-alanine-D-alanine ligase